jgi:hypothetical protein
LNVEPGVVEENNSPSASFRTIDLIDRKCPMMATAVSDDAIQLAIGIEKNSNEINKYADLKVPLM